MRRTSGACWLRLCSFYLSAPFLLLALPSPFFALSFPFAVFAFSATLTCKWAATGAAVWQLVLGFLLSNRLRLKLVVLDIRSRLFTWNSKGELQVCLAEFSCNNEKSCRHWSHSWSRSWSKAFRKGLPRLLSGKESLKLSILITLKRKEASWVEIEKEFSF